MSDVKLCDKCGHSMELHGKIPIRIFLNKDTTVDCSNDIFKCPNCDNIVIPTESIKHIFGIHESINLESMMCHLCGKTMIACRVSKTITIPNRNINVTVDNLDAWKCPDCGEIVYPTSTVKKIQSIINAYRG